MKAPKMLPWLARKAGISDSRADALWAEAIVCATERTGWVGTSEYWQVAVDRLLELIEIEKQVRNQSASQSGVQATPCRPSVLDDLTHKKAA